MIKARKQGIYGLLYGADNGSRTRITSLGNWSNDRYTISAYHLNIIARGGAFVKAFFSVQRVEKSPAIYYNVKKEVNDMINAVYPVLGRQTELPLYLSGIGICEPEYRVLREEGLVSHQFLFTKGGEGELNVYGKRFILKENSIFFLNKYLKIAEEVIDKGPYKADWTSFSDYEVSSDISLERLSSLFELIMRAAKDPVSGGEKASVLLYEFVVEARGIMLLRAGMSHKNDIADKAISYINEKYMNDIPLEELALTSGVCVQHFCRVFRAVTGMRPVEYISNKRISEAKLLLVSTDKKISEIASLVGFNDQNYFGIIFRRCTGLTPTQYRRQRR